jgi:hypothetical protein
MEVIQQPSAVVNACVPLTRQGDHFRDAAANEAKAQF